MRRLALLAIVVIAAPALAQDPTAAERRIIELRSGGPGTIVGIVVDSLGVPIENVDVVIPAIDRGARSNADGIFRIAGLDTGTHVLQARRIGFRPQARRVRIADRGVTVGFVLEAAPYRLPPQMVISRRTGLSGIVMDTAARGLGGARVYAIGTGHRATTDSTGAFYLPLSPGRVMVTVERTGHVPAQFGVTISRDSGRHVEVWLHQGDRGARYVHNMASLRERMLRRSAAYSRVLSREDIMSHPSGQVNLAAAGSAGHVVDANCEAIVDGGPRRIELWALIPEEVEFLEVYTARPQRNEVRSLRQGGRFASSRHMLPRSGICPGLFVWLRQ